MIGVIDSNTLIGNIDTSIELIAQIEPITPKDAYQGEYIVQSSINQQLLSTGNKVMLNDLTIQGISYVEEQNDYGTTIYIGSDINVNQ